MSTASCGRVRVEYGAPQLGLGTGAPRLSWIIAAEDTAWHSDAYEVELDAAGHEAERVVVESSEQVLVPWPFAPLASRSSASVRVRVRSGGTWTEFSEPVGFEIGLLEATEWMARFVSPRSLGGLDDGAPILFGIADVPDLPVSARLHVSALGLYEFAINGVRVGEDVLAPGWTSYAKRVRYQTFDVTSLLTTGPNRLQAILGNGWYRGQLVTPGNRSSYGSRLALIAQLELLYPDGSRRVFGTDDSWRACESGILFDDFYDGQSTDLRIASDPADKRHEAVDVLDEDVARLVAAEGPPVRITEVRPAVAFITSPSGKTLVDFGQNLVGWVRIRAHNGAEGSEVVVRHAEVLEHGELGVRPLRSAKATSRYILAGHPEEMLQPTFTFNGFRYAEITGLPGLAPADVDALVLGTDLERTGWFECSSPGLNRLHDNVVWSTRGNFLSIPMDCPQRDERLGWTGDIQIFAPTAAFLYGIDGFLSSWLRDLALDQKPDGGVPYVIPDVFPPVTDPNSAAWGDAATVVPSVLFDRFGDVEALRRQYGSMRSWVDKIRSASTPEHLWNSGFQFGDWLDPTAPADDSGRAKADPVVIATAYAWRSTMLVTEAAEVLGNSADASTYRELAAAISAAFNREFVDARGVVRSDCQTVYALALAWGLIENPERRVLAGRRLAELVRDAGFTVGTGFVGTPVILEALCAAGEDELAYRMLLETSCPSWLYAVTMGATTIWERWDSMLPDGSINPGEMTSFNHYAYGAVADWLHRSVAGLAPASPGYRDILVRPRVTGALTSASARHDSPYGMIEVAWQLDDGQFTLDVTVPSGVTAKAWLPGSKSPVALTHGHHRLVEPWGAAAS